MKAQITFGNNTYTTDLSYPIDITIPVGRTEGPVAFYLQEAEYAEVEAGEFIGKVARGGSCNCEDIRFNPHGNGTHTECAGHISSEPISIYSVLKQSLFLAHLITITPENGIITAEIIQKGFAGEPLKGEAVIIRTLPNGEAKKHRNYSGTNPPYFHADGVQWLTDNGVKHLITDLPSLDKEVDNKLPAHHALFCPKGQWSMENTATEMVYIDNEIKDGIYLVEIQIAAFESDASPSRIRLFNIS